MVTEVDLSECDATGFSEMVRSRRISSRHLIDATLHRIEELEPDINAFRTVMADSAVAEADRVDALTDAERDALPLAGVPVAVKDDTDVAGESTMWGSRVDRGECTEDAEVVQRIRRAGAIVVGKTTTPELALWPWTASEQWGVTRNPLDLARTPGGSSGGSAAAVSAGMAAMALGSDGGGSIRYPAGLTGLVGLKPQRGRIPVGEEHGSAWHGLIALGPLTRSVRDAALFLDVATGGTPGATFRQAVASKPVPLRVAVAPAPPPGTQVSLSASRQRIIDDTVGLLGGLGHETVQVEIDYGLATLWNSTVRLLKGVQADVATLPNQNLLERRTRHVANLGRLLPERVLRHVLHQETAIAQRLNSVFDNADVVLTPLCEASAPRIGECPSDGALRSLRAANTSAWLVPWNVTGQPAISIPVGHDEDGLPSAVQLVGRPNDEMTLLTLAGQIESHTSTHQG